MFTPKAVVLADCFPARFAPVTQTKPKVLLPLVNVPLLEYTLEFLASQAVEDVSGCVPPRVCRAARHSCVTHAAADISGDVHKGRPNPGAPGEVRAPRRRVDGRVAQAIHVL
jgi:hypothetical protein